MPRNCGWKPEFLINPLIQIPINFCFYTRLKISKEDFCICWSCCCCCDGCFYYCCCCWCHYYESFAFSFMLLIYCLFLFLFVFFSHSFRILILLEHLNGNRQMIFRHSMSCGEWWTWVSRSILLTYTVGQWYKHKWTQIVYLHVTPVNIFTVLLSKQTFVNIGGCIDPSNLNKNNNIRDLDLLK